MTKKKILLSIGIILIVMSLCLLIPYLSVGSTWFDAPWWVFVISFIIGVIVFRIGQKVS